MLGLASKGVNQQLPTASQRQSARGVDRYWTLLLLQIS
jgi:hypothetical protein